MRRSKVTVGLLFAGLVAIGCSESKSVAPVGSASDPVVPTSQEPAAPPVAKPVAQAPAEPVVQAPATDATKTQAASLTLVDPSQVCMVNNQFMGRPQIPVEVSGRTYYGCCEMCKGKLLNNEDARTAVDPASKRPVDKSVAVIAKDAAGDVLYFENEANFAAYVRSIGS